MPSNHDVKYLIQTCNILAHIIKSQDHNVRYVSMNKLSTGAEDNVSISLILQVYIEL